MIDLIEKHRTQINELCTRYGVKRMELFGSAASGKFDPATSDLDFFIEFTDSGWTGSFRRYMGLKLALEDIFRRSVDLVEPDAVTNPYFIQMANRNRRMIYAA